MASFPSRYSTVAIVLHWIIAAAILFQLGLGWRMGAAKGEAAFQAFQLHKSIGIAILVLSLIRLAWRLCHTAPSKLDQPHWERVASRVVHAAFYFVMIGLPVSGWVMVSTSRVDIPTLLFQIVPWPHISWLHDLGPAHKVVWNGAAGVGHQALVYVTLALLVLHVGAVAKHQFLDRDEVVGHMLPAARPVWWEPRLWIVGIAAIVFVAIGRGLIFASSPATAIVAVAPSPKPLATDAARDAVSARPYPKDNDHAGTSALDRTTVASEPTSWLVQKGSTLGFVAFWSGQSIQGQFEKWNADIVFAPDALAHSRLSITVDLASASTGDTQRDASLTSQDWFDVAAQQTGIFETSDIQRVSNEDYQARGTLMLRGFRKPVTLNFSLRIDDDIATARGEATVDRTEFGVGQGMWADTDQIAASVKVPFALTAKRQSPH